MHLSLRGMPVILSPHIPPKWTMRQQFSRSPSRARRRAAKGHKQHFVTREKPGQVIHANGVLYCHPETWEQIKEKLG